MIKIDPSYLFKINSTAQHTAQHNTTQYKMSAIHLHFDMDVTMGPMESDGHRSLSIHSLRIQLPEELETAMSGVGTKERPIEKRTQERKEKKEEKKEEEEEDEEEEEEEEKKEEP